MNVTTHNRRSQSRTQPDTAGTQLEMAVEPRLERCQLCAGRGAFLGGLTCFVCKGEGKHVPHDPATCPWPEGF